MEPKNFINIENIIQADKFIDPYINFSVDNLNEFGKFYKFKLNSFENLLLENNLKDQYTEPTNSLSRGGKRIN